MNFIINAFTRHLPIEDQYECRKRLFGISSALETQKIVFGFFLDRFKADLNESKEILGLRHFEWFGGSLTSAKLSQLLKEFLKSDRCNLLSETRNQIEKVISLLDGQKEQAQFIDLHRSSDFRFPLLTITGKKFLFSQYGFSKDEKVIEKLCQLTFEKLKSLKAEEKALFLVGNLLHETQISVEYKKDKTWELCYYDSNSSIAIYTPEEEHLMKDSFWRTIYTLKFSSEEKHPNIHVHLSQLAQPECDPSRKREASLASQKKNTCHFRCLLAVLKDHIIRHSALELDKARIEWNHFKESFGEFLLASEEIKNLELYHLSTKQQQKRHETTQLRTSFQKCIEEGKYEETLRAYQKTNDIVDANFAISENDPLQTLINAHNALLSRLEKYSLSSDRVEPFFKTMQNPCVQKTFEIYRVRDERKREIFQEQLKEELHFVSSQWNRKWESWKEVSIRMANKVYTGDWLSSERHVQHAAIDEEQLQDLLDNFETHPEWLEHLHTKPCFVALFTQAIQLGKLEQIERIYKKLPLSDQRYLAEACNTSAEFFTPLIPSSAADYLIKNPKTSFAKKISKNICEQILLAHDFPKLLTLVHSPIVFEQGRLVLLSKEIPEEKILDALAAIEVSMKMHKPKRTLLTQMLHAIAKTLVQSKDEDLVNKAKQFSGIPDLKAILNTVALQRAYIQGDFVKVEDLLQSNVEMAPLEKKSIYGYNSLPDYSSSYSPESYKEGIKLLERTEPGDFLDRVFIDLLNSAVKCQSKEMFLEILASLKDARLKKHFKALSDLFLSQETLIFIAESLNVTKLSKKKLKKCLELLIRKVSSEKLFLAINEILENIDKNKGADFIYDLFKKAQFNYLKELEKCSLKYSATILGKKIHCQKLKKDLESLLLEKSFQNFSADYLLKKRQFLKTWKIATKDLDLSDPIKLYQEWILSVFESAFDRTEIDEILNDILPEIPSLEAYKLPFAILWRTKKENEKAAHLFPDEKKLNEMMSKIKA